MRSSVPGRVLSGSVSMPSPQRPAAQIGSTWAVPCPRNDMTILTQCLKTSHDVPMSKESHIRFWTSKKTIVLNGKVSLFCLTNG